MTPEQMIAAGKVIEDGDCLIWQGACTGGHPAVNIRGKWKLLRRVLHEQMHGPIPAGKVLRPTCGNSRCLAREHWKVTTFRQIALECAASGLMSDQVRSGKIAARKRAGKQARITQDDARAIRASDESGRALAQRYGISESTVSKIRRGEVRREFVGNIFAGLA